MNCDFAAFAVYVVKLLNDVIKTHRSIKNASCGENEDESYVDLPDSLIAEFDYASHTFTFLQNSAMKVTRFLYFNLTLADDNATKEYLSGRLQLALDNGEKYLKQNCASDVAFQEQLERYRELEEKLKQKDAERVKQNESFNEEKSEIIMNFTTKLSTMQVDTEKMMLQQRKDLSNEIDSLKAKNNELETINDGVSIDSCFDICMICKYLSINFMITSQFIFRTHQ